MSRVANVLFTLVAASHLAAQVRSDTDVSALLQGSIEKRRLEDQPMLEEIPESESEHAELLQKCEPVKDVKNPSSAPLSIKKDVLPDVTAAKLETASDMEKEDPPGAATLKMVLQLMVIGLFMDAMRRLKQQKAAQAEMDAIAKKVSIKKIVDDDNAEKAWTDMVEAASEADLPQFEKALVLKPSMTRADPWGCTPLHFAAKGGSAEIVSELLKRGVEVDAVDAMDETPLHFAARGGHVEVCEALLAQGASKDPTNVQDMTPLVVAGHAKQAPTVSFLLNKGAGVAGLTDESLPPLIVSEIVKRVFAGAAPRPDTTESPETTESEQ